MPSKLVLFHLHFHALTIAILSWLVSLFFTSKLQSPNLCSLSSCSMCTSTSSHHTKIHSDLHWISTGCPQEPEFPVKLHASVLPTSPPPPLPISLTFHICTLLLNLFAPMLTPASSKSHSISAEQKVIVFFSHFGLLL